MIDYPTRDKALKPVIVEDLLNGILVFCQENNFGLAIWRLPESEEIQAIIDHSTEWSIADTPLEDLDEGFIFSPFDNQAKKYYLKAQIKINLSARTLKGSDNELIDQLIKRINQVTPSDKKNRKKRYSQIESNSGSFENLVRLAVEEIKSNTFQKVVPSRHKQIELNDTYSVANHFIRLEKQYKNSFISLTYTPETNIWLGATPEILIKTEGSLFKTVALAGTQKHDAEVAITDIAWTQKEIEEQAFVSRYIINCFKKIRLREFEEHGPKTIIAGNLIHLKTEFTVDMEATNFPQLGSVMLELLHPTSAICGMPLEAAHKFLKTHEGYDRKFFSGYLGPVNHDTGTSLFVNLRCMEIANNNAILYAGAGVTENSNPSKEWRETEMKMNTLLNVLDS